MKITVLINSLLFVQVSTSFMDVFQGAVHSVQNSFGKLFSDVVTDVKDTVDCTILAVEHVLSLSDDATKRYYDKCGNAKNETVNNIQQKDGSVPTVEISISSNDDQQNKLLPEEIDAKINETMSKYFKDYNPHDKLLDVERELAKETERLGEVSNLVKQELDKLSNGIHVRFSDPDNKDPKMSVDTILQELRLLESIEQNLKNSSDANEIHKIIENILHRLDAIAASEVTESAKVEKVLDDLSSKSNNSYNDLRKRLDDWKKDEGRNLDTIKKKIEEHETSPEHHDYLQINVPNTTPEVLHNDDTVNSYRSTIPIINNSLIPAQPIVDGITTTTALPTLAPSVLADSTPRGPVIISPHNIELLSTESVPSMLNTDASSLSSPSLNNNSLVTTTMSIIPTYTSSVVVPNNISIETSTLTTPKSTTLNTTVKIDDVESTTIPSNTSDNDTRTTAESSVHTSINQPVPEPTKFILTTTNELTTPKIENKPSVSNKTQTRYISETSTPVAITTSLHISEVNYTSPNTQKIYTTDSPTTIGIKDEQSDNIINITLLTTTPSTKSEVEIEPSTYITPPLMSQNISTDDSTTVPAYTNEHNTRDPVTSTEPSVTNGYNMKDVPFSLTIISNLLSLSTPPITSTQSLSAFLEHVDGLTATPPMTTTQSLSAFLEYVDSLTTTPPITTTQSLGAFLEYVDSLTTTTPMPSLTSSYDATRKEDYDALPTSPPNLHDESQLKAMTHNSIAPIDDDKFTPSIYPSRIPKMFLPLNNHMQPQMPFHVPLPYRRNNDPINRFNNPRHPPMQFMPTESGFNENRQPIQPFENGNSPTGVFNERPNVKAHRPSQNSNTANFDDPDYDSFFHLPSKNTNVHDQAVRDARKLIEDSMRSHRVMQNILNRKRKGISAFGLPKK